MIKRRTTVVPIMWTGEEEGSSQSRQRCCCDDSGNEKKKRSIARRTMSSNNNVVAIMLLTIMTLMFSRSKQHSNSRSFVFDVVQSFTTLATTTTRSSTHPSLFVQRYQQQQQQLSLWRIQQPERYQQPMQLTRPTNARQSSRTLLKMIMFEKMSEPLINALVTAQNESANLNLKEVDVECMFLGIVDHPQNSAKTLRSYGINSFREARQTLQNMYRELNDEEDDEGSTPGKDQSSPSSSGGSSSWGSMFNLNRKARDVELPFAPSLKRVLTNSLKLSDRLESETLNSEHVLLALLDYDPTTNKSLTEEEGSLEYAVGAHAVLLRLKSVDADTFSKTEFCRTLLKDMKNNPKELVGVGSSGESSETPTLKEIGIDLTEQARNYELDPVFGRESEVYMAVRTLLRRRKNNPCLVGEPGVGKSAIVEGIAQILAAPNMLMELDEISDKDEKSRQRNKERRARLEELSKLCPTKLANHRVISIELGNLVAGTRYRGEFEERVQSIVKELSNPESPPTIVFMDEIHMLINAGSAEGGGMDAANILKPALARGTVQLIGATTIAEYRKCIEKDMALERRLQPIMIQEPTTQDTRTILEGIKSMYEQHHQVTYTEKALEAMVKMSERYVNDRFLPDKAIDLMDECGAMADMERHSQLNDNFSKGKINGSASFSSGGNPVVTEHSVATIISEWTGIPTGKLETEETSQLIQLEDDLTEKVKGQYPAIHAVSRAIRRARSGLRDTNRPICSFLFCGPTGVGKTELCKRLAELYYRSTKNMIHIDMSEYMENHSVARLIGSPPGYIGYEEGGQLTEAVRRAPHSLVLLDEMEKAHSDVLNILLQILEDGQLTDGKGRVVDFTHTILVMTSNVGSKRILNVASGGEDEDSTSTTMTDEERNQQLINKLKNNSKALKIMKDAAKDGSLKKSLQKINVDNPEQLLELAQTDSKVADFLEQMWSTLDMEEKEEETMEGDDDEDKYTKMKQVVMEELQNELKPELLNRVDEICVFQPLSKENLRCIAQLILGETITRAYQERTITLKASDNLLDAIMVEGSQTSTQFGARPMRRAIQRYFEDTVSDAIIRGFLTEGDTATISLSKPKKKNPTNSLAVDVKRQRDGKVWTCPVAGGGTGVQENETASPSSTTKRRSSSDSDSILMSNAIKG